MSQNIRTEGGDRWDIGGELRVLNGGTITADGEQAGSIADHADPATATAEDIATKQNAILAALRGVGIIASS